MIFISEFGYSIAFVADYYKNNSDYSIINQWAEGTLNLHLNTYPSN